MILKLRGCRIHLRTPWQWASGLAVILLMSWSTHPLLAVEVPDGSEPAQAEEAPAAEAEAPVAETEAPAVESEAPAAETKEDPAISAMREEIERLRLAQELREARLRASIQEMQEKAQRIEAELALAAARQRASLAELHAEQERLQAEATVKESREQARLREQRVQQEEQALALQRQESLLQEESLQRRREIAQQEHQAALMQFAQAEQQQQVAEQQFELSTLEMTLQAMAQREAVAAILPEPAARPLNPYQDGVLTISDRRIDLNEPIITGTGDWIARRIHFFNNESQEEPIFLVIDYCPGGSVMDGEIILRAMASSQAPVHVVVKTFAASMAAIIVGDAPFSYALPNAIIMHHQPSSVTMGNLAQQQEWVKVFRHWAERIHGPTAERMGLTLDEFYARMYEEAVSGDWSEFADGARELNWVKEVVREIHEDDVRRRPQDESPFTRFAFYWSNQQGSEAVAAGGAVTEKVRLPRPRALDFYFIYNRDNRFFIRE